MLSSFTNKVKTQALNLGFDLVGITSADPPRHGNYYATWIENGMSGEMSYLERHINHKQNPDKVLPNIQSLVVVAMNYRCPDSEPIPDGSHRGKIAQYARGDDYHRLMKDKLQELLQFIQEKADRPVQGKVYVDTGPVLEREFAVRAGLGWFGKHTNLINKNIGSWLLIGEILLDLELIKDKTTTDHCGTCTKCIEACPTDAIPEPYVVDSRRCISYLTIELKGEIPLKYRETIGNHVFGCDDCQDVCPWNRKAHISQHPEFYSRPWNEMPDLISMLRWSSKDFQTRFKNSPIKRTKRKGLLRNAAVALGNTKDPAAIAPLVISLSDEEPLVRSHAAWALGNIGGDKALSALLMAKNTEKNPDVIREIEMALTST